MSEALSNVVQQLLRDEGKRNKPYTDVVGKITIGVGRNLTDVGLSDDEVELLLKNDIGRVKEELSAFGWYSGLDEVRQGAVENMCFNLGLVGLLHFPAFIAALHNKDFKTAKAEMLNSKWRLQVGDRAVRLAEQILTGEWQ